jgi:hypothetical protein
LGSEITNKLERNETNNGTNFKEKEGEEDEK